MPGVRHLTVVLFTAICIVTACANVASPEQTSPPVAVATGSEAEATAEAPSEPPALVSAAPTVAPPIVEPSQAPEPTATTPAAEPEPTEPPAPQGQPNLVVSEFIVEEDPVLVGTTATVTATITNTGSDAAGRFFAEIVIITADQPDLVLESKAFEDGLPMGFSTRLTTSIDPNEAGGLRLVARVDVTDVVNESDESDNERVLELIIQGGGNLSFTAADPFTVTAGGDPAAPRLYIFQISLANSGPSTLVGTMSVKYFAYTEAGDYVEWGTVDFDLDLAPGDPFVVQVAFPVDPGTYRAYALADSGEAFEETNEDDNEAYYDFTAP